MKLTCINLNCWADGYYVIYIDDKKYDEGDDYHDKISYKWEGLKEFLEFRGEKHEIKELNFDFKKEDKSLCDYDFQPNEDESLKSYLSRVRKFMKEVK